MDALPKIKEKYEVDGFVAQAVEVLEAYDDEVIIYATDPKTGVQRTVQYDLKLRDIAQACDDRAEAVKRRAAQSHARRFENRPYMPPMQFHGSRANVFVGKDVPRYAALLAFTQSMDADSCDWRFDTDRGGIWVSYHIWCLGFVGGRKGAWSASSETKVVQKYSQAKVDNSVPDSEF